MSIEALLRQQREARDGPITHQLAVLDAIADIIPQVHSVFGHHRPVAPVEPEFDPGFEEPTFDPGFYDPIESPAAIILGVLLLAHAAALLIWLSTF